MFASKDSLFATAEARRAQAGARRRPELVQGAREAIEVDGVTDVRPDAPGDLRGLRGPRGGPGPPKAAESGAPKWSV